MTDNRIECGCEKNVHPENSTRRTENFEKCKCTIKDPSRKTEVTLKVKRINIISKNIDNA